MEVKPLDVAVLKGNDKLVRLYTGMPTYDSLMAFVEYLEPKASEMISWNSSRTKELSMKGKQSGTKCFSSISIAGNSRPLRKYTQHCLTSAVLPNY